MGTANSMPFGYAVNESHQRVRANALQWMKDHRADCEAFVLQARSGWGWLSMIHGKQMMVQRGNPSAVQSGFQDQRGGILDRLSANFNGMIA